MPGWLEAAGWGFAGGGALILGALVAWFVSVPQRVVAWIMAFGARRPNLGAGVRAGGRGGGDRRASGLARKFVGGQVQAVGLLR